MLREELDKALSYSPFAGWKEVDHFVKWYTEKDQIHSSWDHDRFYHAKLLLHVKADLDRKDELERYILADFEWNRKNSEEAAKARD